VENMPIWLTYFISVVFGLIFGSFVNVLILRLPKGQSVVLPNSRCPKCEKSIRWWDNIPVLSFLLLKGKCRFCRKPISVRYPVVELLTALLFLTCRVKFGWTSVLFFHDWPLMVLLVAVAFIDLDHHIIPDQLSLGGLVLGLSTCWMVPQLGWMNSFLGAFFGFSVFYALAWSYQKVRRVSGLGGGDIKFLATIGAFLGPSGVVATIFVSSIVGSSVGIGWALLSKKQKLLQLSIPYGPFLVIGALYYHFLGDILWFQFMTPM
jgi:leader peptidase (prepilin peptidase)/N-methyltransferase